MIIGDCYGVPRYNPGRSSEGLSRRTRLSKGGASEDFSRIILEDYHEKSPLILHHLPKSTLGATISTLDLSRLTMNLAAKTQQKNVQMYIPRP